VGYAEPLPPVAPPPGVPIMAGGTVLPPIVRDAALNREPGMIVDAHQSGPNSWNLTISTNSGLRNLEVRDDGLILSDTRDQNEDLIRNLPPQVRSSVESAFPGAVIYNVEEGAADGQPALRIEVLQNGQQSFAIVAPNGTIINQGLLPPAGR
jgi:hypothetical protein